MFDVLILLFAIVLFTVLAFKRVGALPMAGIVALITCILAQMPVLDTMLGPFMESAANYVKNYFFIFFLGAVFSAFYEGSGAAKSIARFLSRLTGGKHVAVLVFIIVYQQIENLILSPRISQRTMDINAAVAFLSVLAFGSLFGAFGAFLALPGAADAVCPPLDSTRHINSYLYRAAHRSRLVPDPKMCV